MAYSYGKAVLIFAAACSVSIDSLMLYMRWQLDRAIASGEPLTGFESFGFVALLPPLAASTVLILGSLLFTAFSRKPLPLRIRRVHLALSVGTLLLTIATLTIVF